MAFGGSLNKFVLQLVALPRSQSPAVFPNFGRGGEPAIMKNTQIKATPQKISGALHIFWQKKYKVIQDKKKGKNKIHVFW
jgi:hypothetical protein